LTATRRIDIPFLGSPCGKGHRLLACGAVEPGGSGPTMIGPTFGGGSGRLRWVLGRARRVTRARRCGHRTMRLCWPVHASTIDRGWQGLPEGNGHLFSSWWIC